MRIAILVVMLSFAACAGSAGAGNNDDNDRHIFNTFTPPPKPATVKAKNEAAKTAMKAAGIPKEDTAFELVDKRKGTIKNNGMVWWRGANQKDALLEDGVHPLKDGSSITTKGGRLMAWDKSKSRPENYHKTQKSPEDAFPSAPPGE